MMLKCESEVSPGECISFKHEDKMFQKLINFSLFIVSQDEVIFFLHFFCKCYKVCAIVILFKYSK